MPANKNDRHAREHWGDSYDKIPKSVFATLCWHLANVASDSAGAPGAAERRTIVELDALATQLMPEKQARDAEKVLREALKRAEQESSR